MATAIGGAVASYFGLTAGTTAYAVVQTAVAVAVTVGAGYAAKALTAAGQDSGYNRETGMVTVKQPAVPWQYVYGKVRKGGSYAFIHSTHNNKYLHMVIILADREVESIDEIYFDDQVIALDENGNATGTDKNGDNFKGYARVIKRTGTDDQTAFAELIADAPDMWTTAHRLRGKACIYVRLKHNLKRFPRGVPNITAVIKGHKIYDPRDTGQDPNDKNTWEYSTNAENVIADYIRDKDISLNVDAENIPTAEWVAGANACDENVPRAGGGTEKRYACAGVVESSDSILSNLEGLLTSMHGEVVTNGSVWKIYPAVWRAATKSLDESDLRNAGPTTKTRRTRKELYNGVRGTYKSPENEYQLADYPAVISEAFKAQDGKENFLDIELPFTQSPATAQRIAKILLLESRQQITTTWPVKMTAWDISAADNVMLNREKLGWSDKFFRVKRAPTVLDNGAMGVNLQMVETDPSIFDWDTSEENTVDPAPDTNLPNPQDVSAPEDVTVESGSNLLQIDSTGQVHSQLKVTIFPPLDTFANDYLIEWRRAGDDEWNELTVPARNEMPTSFVLSSVIDGDVYHVRAYSRSRFGVASDYTEATPHLVEGKSGAPRDVDQFTISIQADGTREFQVIHNNPDADVRVGGGYQILYSAGPTIDVDIATPLNTGVIKSWPYETNKLGAGEYTFACLVIDSSGHLSENPKIITATLPDPRLKNAVAAWDEKALGWPGVTTGFFKNYENNLEAESAGDWDDLTTWDALTAEWSDLLPAVSVAVYETQVFTIGADVLITPLVYSDANGTVSIEMRTAKTADGGDLSALSYGPIGQVSCGFIQFQVTVTGPNPCLKSLSPILDGEMETDFHNDINTTAPTQTNVERIGTGHFKVGITKNIAAITLAQVTAIQNVSGGWTTTVVTKASTLTGGGIAAEFKIFDENNALADAIVDIQLRGPKA